MFEPNSFKNTKEIQKMDDSSYKKTEEKGSLRKRKFADNHLRKQPFNSQAPLKGKRAITKIAEIIGKNKNINLFIILKLTIGLYYWYSEGKIPLELLTG